jgi:hypothetical protein
MAASPSTVGGTPARTARRGPARVRRLTTETKASFKSSEFYAFLAVLVGLLIAGHVIDTDTGTGGDHFSADKVWLYATILTVGYMVSRGLAKAGNAEPYWDGGSNEERPDGADGVRR